MPYYSAYTVDTLFTRSKTETLSILMNATLDDLVPLGVVEADDENAAIQYFESQFRPHIDSLNIFRFREDAVPDTYKVFDTSSGGRQLIGYFLAEDSGHAERIAVVQSFDWEKKEFGLHFKQLDSIIVRNNEDEGEDNEDDSNEDWRFPDNWSVD